MQRMNGWCAKWILAAVLSPVVLCAQGNASVTLFNSGRVLVRRTMPVNVPAGTSTQSLALGVFNPSTLSTLDAGTSVLRVAFDQTWSEDALLRRNIGRVIEFDMGDKPRKSATLLSMDPERWEWTAQWGGGVVFGRPGKLIWPKEIVPGARIADVTVESDRAHDGLRLMYEMDGGFWSASYKIFLGALSRVEGVSSISAGSLDLKDAEVQLLAGNIGSVRSGAAGGRGGAMNALAAREMIAQAPAPSYTTNEALGDAHVYTLPGRTSFSAGSQLVVPLFQPVPARTDRRYTVGGAVPIYGSFGRNEDEQAVPVNVAYRLPHKQGTPFGDLALPGGNVSIYDTDNSGRVQMIAMGYIEQTGPGAEITIETGTAFDVTCRRVQTDYLAVPSTKLGKSVATAGYRYTLKNAKDSAIVVEVREDRNSDWSVVESSVPAEKRSSTRRVFSVPVPARDSAVLTYRLRVTW